MTTASSIRTFTLPDGSAFEMILVEGGAFLRGDVQGNLFNNARPAHPVLLGSSSTSANTP